jgi:hypothetical protein
MKMRVYHTGGMREMWVPWTSIIRLRDRYIAAQKKTGAIVRVKICKRYHIEGKGFLWARTRPI